MGRDKNETGGETTAEQERRFERTLRNMLSTPPQPHGAKNARRETVGASETKGIKGQGKKK